MPTVIDAVSYVGSKRRLPVEAFFVDTNIVIAAVDPFSASIHEPQKSLYTEIQSVLHVFRSVQQVKCFYISIVAWEYYNYVRWMYYKTQNPKAKFSTEQFKQLRNADPAFLHGWEGQLKAFNNAFGKKYLLLEPTVFSTEWFKGYGGTNVDLADSMIVYQMMAADEKYRCVFSNDSDFLNFKEPFYLLTTNGKIIETARKIGTLFGG